MSPVVLLKAIYARLEIKRTRLRKPNGGYERPRKQLALNGQQSFPQSTGASRVRAPSQDYSQQSYGIVAVWENSRDMEIHWHWSGRASA